MKSLNIVGKSVLLLSLAATVAMAAVEKKDLKIGFIPLTDCAALVIAKEKGFFAIALDGDGDMNLDQVDPDLADRPLILVIGAEGRGVSRLVAQTCDLRVQIPMSKKIESLNAAVATGVALYSITRSRKLD